MTMLADFHIHSTFSDGSLTVPELVDFYGSRGFGAIAITDHICEEKTWIGVLSSYLGKTLTPATFPIYREILRSEADRAWDQFRMVLLPGFEISKNSISNHRSAHVLGIGRFDTFTYVAADGEILEPIKKIKAQGAIAAAAHPVWTRKREKQTYHLWDRREELAGVLDAWEIASGPHLFEEVRRTGLPKIATSDLHRPSQINAWKTVLNCERHPDAILDAIRKQEVSFHYYRELARNRESITRGTEGESHRTLATTA
ncbi:MAG: PHP domain-containing protein [Oligoflexia bacterium]|nr:PHP domain-containing protein [Oligoflexia bacterium]